MSCSKVFVALMCMTLSAICLLPVYSAYEERIPIVAMKNISFDLDSEQDYNISTNATMAMSVQEITINSTMPDGKNATMVIMSMNLEGAENQIINQSQFSSAMEDMYLAAMRLANARELEKVTVNSTWGENVTLHRLEMPSDSNQPANEIVTAFWDLDELNHVILTSEMGMNASSKIVETMKIAP